jgi:hypothetical protein
MSKMGSYDPFEYLKHKLWLKKGRRSNCQFDSRPLKVQNRPELHVFKWHVTYHLKAFDKGYNFAFNISYIITTMCLSVRPTTIPRLNGPAEPARTVGQFRILMDRWNLLQ